jgi:DNA-directed RNA polymerase subunit RPC12/RpoP
MIPWNHAETAVLSSGSSKPPHIWREQIVCPTCYQKLAAYKDGPMQPSQSYNDLAKLGRVVSLKCENCGGRLDVGDDMERFACGYCGAEMVVQRRGGTVALKGVTEAIGKVQVGTDKTAAELAISRHEKELAELRGTQAELNRQVGEAGVGIGCAGFLFVFGVVGLATGIPMGCGLSIFFLSAICLVGFAAKMAGLTDRRKTLGIAIRDKEQQVAAKRQVADG